MTAIAPAGEHSSQSARWTPDTELTAACATLRIRTVGSRCESNDAVAPGKINMAITRIAPTDSNALTTTTDRMLIKL